MKFSSNTIYIVLGILLVIIIIGLAYFFISGDDQDVTVNTNSYILSQPGPTEVECTVNDDCINICKDDGCLISSCVKSQGNTIGKCGCFDLCGN